MDETSAFAPQVLNEIFRPSPARPDCLVSRESTGLEFKQSFNWGNAAEYARTGAAFANTKGGYIVFGVKNHPRKMLGMKPAAVENFEEIDQAKVTGFLNEHFAPEIHWDMHLHEIGGLHFGMLHFRESSEKPVVCCKTAGDSIKEGEIYYRYRGRTTTIRYPELRTILDTLRRNEQRAWLKHLSQIARVGVRNAGVFDFRTGRGSAAGGTFIIDESLLSQIAFIKEGEFSEEKGKPTLKLLGKAEVVSGSVPTPRRVVKTKGIRTGDIVLSFLNNEKVPEPIDYLTQLCFETTAFLPVFCYLSQAKLSAPDGLQLLKGVVSRSQSKARLLQRVSEEDSLGLRLSDSQSVSASKKRELHAQLLAKKVNERITGQELRYCLEAVRCLSKEEVNARAGYLRGLLKSWFNMHYSGAEGCVADGIRRAICWLDEALYRDEVPAK